MNQSPAEYPHPLSPLESAIAEKFSLSPAEIPEIKLEYIFVKHAEAHNARILQEPVKNADIVLCEWFGGGENAKEFLREVTHGYGVFAAYGEWGGYDGDEFRDAFYSMIEDTKKIVVPLDIPSDHQAYEKMNKLISTAEEFQRSIWRGASGDFDTAFARFRSLGEQYAAIQRERENHINEVMIPTILDRLENNQQLLRKPNLSIVVSFGSFHTGLYHHAKRSIHPAASRIFPRTPFRFGFGIFDIPARGFRFGVPPSEDALLYSFLRFFDREMIEQLLQLEDAHFTFQSPPKVEPNAARKKYDALQKSGGCLDNR